MLTLIALPSRVAVAEGQGSKTEEGYAATRESVDAGQAFWVEFTMYVKAQVRFEYKVESGKQLDLYIMTEAQFQRGKAGAEPKTPGKDFIRYTHAIAGQGSDVEDLSPGRYAIVFRNLDSKPINVWTHSTAVRQ
jgi:hypothetical protein